ncbi:MAG: nicotinate-nucleotide adenylyltransferase [Rhodobacterales bacterium]|nr:nicotinate-nucleotide adenylyltransferase [Rhodobacterales bacterium]
MSVGLLGGSFNPAHAGHRHISLLALDRLGLDAVWWLASPQNPLKDAGDMAPLARRLAGARAVAAHPRIRVTDVEARLGTRFTADTLAALQARYPATFFVWLMGADNLAQIPRWQRWTRVFERAPVAVFDRPTYAIGALSGKAAQRYARHRIPERAARTLARRMAPAWCFLHIPLHAASATHIRARHGRAGAA